MADPSKTEKATPKRRNKEREEGNVPKSQEMSKGMSLFVGLIGLYVYIGVMYDHIRGMFQYILKNATQISLTNTEAYRLLYMVVTELAVILLPIFLLLFASSIIVMRLQVGALWTTSVFKMRWSNFNLIKGIKRILFSPQTFFRLFKSLAFALVIGYIPYLYIMHEYPSFINLYYSDAASLVYFLLSNALWLTLYTIAPMLIIGVADLLYTRYKYEEGIKMTKQEVKDEHKQQEGDPLIKQKQKQKMFTMMMSRMTQDIPRADVVITNPTHYAVALMYDPTLSPAPLVVAKGVDHLAKRIRDIAEEHKVPIRENKALARALYAQVEIGQIIPEDLYKAVASLLAEIWRLKGKKMPV